MPIAVLPTWLQCSAVTGCIWIVRLFIICALLEDKKPRGRSSGSLRPLPRISYTMKSLFLTNLLALVSAVAARTFTVRAAIAYDTMNSGSYSSRFTITVRSLSGMCAETFEW